MSGKNYSVMSKIPLKHQNSIGIMKKIVKNFFFLAPLLVTNKIFAQLTPQSAYYTKAANDIRIAEGKTACPDRARVLEEYAKWNDRMAASFSNPSISVGPAPTTPIPPCSGDMIGGGNGSGGSGNSTTSSQLKAAQSQAQSLNSQNAATNAYQSAISNGSAQSTAILDATLAGARQISDPKESLAFTGVGLSVSLISYMSERSQEKKARETAAAEKSEEIERKVKLQRLMQVKQSLSFSTDVFNFISGSTDYHIASLRLEKSKSGENRNIYRRNLYNMNIQIVKVVNTRDSLFIYEVERFTNLNFNKDSCIITKICIPFAGISEVRAYTGNYTNNFDKESSSFQTLRYKELTNKELKSIFYRTDDSGMDNQDYGVIQSGLTDVYISAFGAKIKIYKKYLADYHNISTTYFGDIQPYYVNRYMLVFDERNQVLYDFVDDLNFIKP
jgi:hypothetical protein